MVDGLSGKKTKMNILSIVISTALGIYTVVQIYPLIWLLLFSLKDNGEIFAGNILGLPSKFLWQNYRDALFGGNVILYFFNSILVTAVTIILSGIAGLMASYAIARMKWKLSKAALVIFLLGIMIPIHATLLPMFIVLTKLKIINSYLSLILPYTAFSLPMGIFIFVGFLKSLPKELEESAYLDGASIYRTFVSIMMPLIKPAIATVSIFTYLSSWNELMFAVTFISKQQFKTLTVGIMSMVGQFSTKWGPIGAGLVVATIPTIIIYCFMSSQVQQSLTAGALKG